MSRSTVGILVAALAACGGTKTTSQAPIQNTPSAGDRVAPLPEPALSRAECAAARRRKDSFPNCDPPECTTNEMLIQRTVENEVWHYRASRSCSRVTARAWYDCKMAAKTYKAWLACERTLVPPYQELTEKTDTVALEPGVLYVDGEEIISITQLQEGRAILLDVDSGTDEKREIVLTTGLEIELDHHYLDGLTPEARAACIADNVCVEMGGFDLNAGLDGPPQPTHLRGPRFRVTEIDRTKQRVVLTRLSSW